MDPKRQKLSPEKNDVQKECHDAKITAVERKLLLAETRLKLNDVQKECQDAKITALERKLEHMENKLKLNDAQKECQEEKITALERKLEHMENKIKLVIAELEQVKEERARDKINFETAKCELESKIDKYKEQCTELQSENKRLLMYLQDLESSNINAEEKSQIILYNNTDLKNQITKVNESIDDALDINSLPDEVIVEVFGYLEQNQLGQIARVSRRWNVLTRRPILWKKVNVHFSPSHESQTTVAKHFINLLPPCVTHLKLNFIDRWSWIERFNFEEISVKLKEKCPDLEVLILEEVVLTDSLPSAIDLCTLYLHKVKILAFHFCEFPDCPRNNKRHGISKIEVLELKFCDLGCLNKPSFSQLPYLKQLHLKCTCNINSWFHGDTSFINQLHVLDLGYMYISSRTFQAIQIHGHNLSELYLCGTYLDDIDLTFNNSVFPHLKTICLGSCSRGTCEGVISLIQSYPSLSNVYVDENVAKSYAAHPFIVANRCKAGIIKSIHIGHTHNYLLKTVGF